METTNLLDHQSTVNTKKAWSEPTIELINIQSGTVQGVEGVQTTFGFGGYENS